MQMSHQSNDNTTVHFSLFSDQYSTEELQVKINFQTKSITYHVLLHVCIWI